MTSRPFVKQGRNGDDKKAKLSNRFLCESFVSLLCYSACANVFFIIVISLFSRRNFLIENEFELKIIFGGTQWKRN